MSSYFRPAEAVVTIEYPTGHVFSGKALISRLPVFYLGLINTTVSTVGYNQFLPTDEMEWRLELRGVSPLVLVENKE